MIRRCEAAGVRIYADVIPNHAYGAGGTGTVTGGTSFTANTMDFPGVPWSSNDFNHNKCQCMEIMLIISHFTFSQVKVLLNQSGYYIRPTK